MRDSPFMHYRAVAELVVMDLIQIFIRYQKGNVMRRQFLFFEVIRQPVMFFCESGLGIEVSFRFQNLHTERIDIIAS